MKRRKSDLFGYLCILNVLSLNVWSQTPIKQIISPAHFMSYAKGTWLECIVLLAIFSVVIWDPKEEQVCHLDESALRHLRLEGSPYQRWAQSVGGWRHLLSVDSWQLTIGPIGKIWGVLSVGVSDLLCSIPHSAVDIFTDNLSLGFVELTRQCNGRTL